MVVSHGMTTIYGVFLAYQTVQNYDFVQLAPANPHLRGIQAVIIGAGVTLTYFRYTKKPFATDWLILNRASGWKGYKMSKNIGLGVKIMAIVLYCLYIVLLIVLLNKFLNKTILIKIIDK